MKIPIPTWYNKLQPCTYKLKMASYQNTKLVANVWPLLTLTYLFYCRDLAKLLPEHFFPPQYQEIRCKQPFLHCALPTQDYKRIPLECASKVQPGGTFLLDGPELLLHWQPRCSETLTPFSRRWGGCIFFMQALSQPEYGLSVVEATEAEDLRDSKQMWTKPANTHAVFFIQNILSI